MTDAVLCEDGFIYEREAITDWVTRGNSSPQTRQPLAVPNWVSVQHLVDEVQDEQKN